MWDGVSSSIGMQKGIRILPKRPSLSRNRELNPTVVNSHLPPVSFIDSKAQFPKKQDDNFPQHVYLSSNILGESFTVVTKLMIASSAEPFSVIVVSEPAVAAGPFSAGGGHTFTFDSLAIGVFVCSLVGLSCVGR